MMYEGKASATAATWEARGGQFHLSDDFTFVDCLFEAEAATPRRICGELRIPLRRLAEQSDARLRAC